MLNLHNFYCTVATIINKYHSPLIMQNTAVELSREMKEKSLIPKVVQARVETEALRIRRGQWIVIYDNILPDFLILDLHYLETVTIICAR